ncbi:unnamed protein product [Nippostrongylus brasiliensis]|uniref:Mab-21 domain-containing protein n=1 Tax=Nippostrongylus brasiliensis TaxID=27835 RepID=A0A0N4Y833_NIPBR|nr:unnamed protein product [Nippostrongylus brasiliensis]
MNLPKYWAIFNNDKYFTDVLFEDISVNLTHFFVLFALHSLRTQTKVGFVDGVALFFFTETYTKLKSSLAANAAKNGSSKVRLISGDDSLLSDDSAIDRIAPSCSTPTSQRSGAVNTESHSNSHVEATNGASIDRSTTTNDDESGRSAVKRKSTIEDGKSDSPKLKFPRDRPPDDIPVYDYTKVKREKFDPNFSAMETGSQISNESSSNRLSRSSVVDEWEEVLKTVTTDPSVSDEYKMAFRCLVMSNRDLREHNKVLRSQLERAVGKHDEFLAPGAINAYLLRMLRCVVSDQYWTLKKKKEFCWKLAESLLAAKPNIPLMDCSENKRGLYGLMNPFNLDPADLQEGLEMSAQNSRDIVESLLANMLRFFVLYAVHGFRDQVLVTLSQDGEVLYRLKNVDEVSTNPSPDEAQLSAPSWQPRWVSDEVMRECIPLPDDYIPSLNHLKKSGNSSSLPYQVAHLPVPQIVRLILGDALFLSTMSSSPAYPEKIQAGQTRRIVFDRSESREAIGPKAQSDAPIKRAVDETPRNNHRSAISDKLPDENNKQEEAPPALNLQAQEKQPPSLLDTGSKESTKDSAWETNFFERVKSDNAVPTYFKTTFGILVANNKDLREEREFLQLQLNIS